MIPTGDAYSNTKLFRHQRVVRNPPNSANPAVVGSVLEGDEMMGTAGARKGYRGQGPVSSLLIWTIWPPQLTAGEALWMRSIPSNAQRRRWGYQPLVREHVFDQVFFERFGSTRFDELEEPGAWDQ